MSARMSRADRRAWRTARTLEDLGRLGALWLEGELGSQPAWRAGPDNETLPLVPVLAAANRAGFYTMASSPADDTTGSDGVRWRQRAAVEGFADAGLARRLHDAARAAGLISVTLCPDGRPGKGWDRAFEVGVTERDGDRYTWFSQHLSRREIRSRRVGWGICRRAAVKALCGAWQVALIDPEWGRPDVLWRVLEDAVTARSTS